MDRIFNILGYQTLGTSLSVYEVFRMNLGTFGTCTHLAAEFVMDLAYKNLKKNRQLTQCLANKQFI